MSAMMIWDNPLVMRGIRSRMRLAHALSWGLVTIVAATFIYIFVSSNALRFGNTTPQEAAREAILPLLILQGVILMVMGTGAVAGGMARERTYRLLDYQRLTPMKPGAKIVGMLVGLPIREYYMFALTVPFVFYAAWVGGMSYAVLLQFYAVFISSAIVYHMTGLTAGMVVDKPWRAGTVSQGLVIVLYLLLPQISRFGFTFFEFLTARPAFYGLVHEHLLPDGLAGLVQSAMIDPRYQSVAFFGMRIPPTFFSLAVQAYALISLYVIVYRKWQSDARLPFSKGYALLFFAFAQLFLVGSVQPLIRSDVLFEQFHQSYNQFDPTRDPGKAVVFIVLMVNLLVSGAAAILTLYLCTPTWHQSIGGVRRSLRRGDKRLSWADDTASCIPIAVACVLMSWLGFLAVYQTALSAGRLEVDNSLLEVCIPLLFFASVVLCVQQVCEQFGERIFVMALFVFWIIPVLGAIITASAFNHVQLAMYIAMCFPPWDVYLAVTLLLSDAGQRVGQDMMPMSLAGHAEPVLLLSLLLYGGSASLLLLRARWRWQRIHAAAGAKPVQVSNKGKDDAAISRMRPAPAYVRTDDAPPSRT